MEAECVPFCHLQVIDNNTWNNTHIASVALAFSAPEGVSARVMSVLGVDYVMVVFGGMTGFVFPSPPTMSAFKHL
jgi:hypothetical protein